MIHNIFHKETKEIEVIKKDIKEKELIIGLGKVRRLDYDDLQYPIDKTCFICLVHFSGFTDGVNGAIEHREMFCKSNEVISMCNHCKVLNDKGIKDLLYRQLGCIKDKWKEQFGDYINGLEMGMEHEGQHKTTKDWIKSYPNGWDCHNKYYKYIGMFGEYTLYEKWERK